MSVITQKVKEVNRLQLYVIVALRQSIIEQSEFIEELNRSQLDNGQRSDGSVMPNYAPVSVEMGKPSGPIKLFDEGSFWEGINVNVFEDELRIEGEDEKTPMLIEKYGKMILGLDEYSQSLLIQVLKKTLPVKMKSFYRSI